MVLIPKAEVLDARLINYLILNIFTHYLFTLSRDIQTKKIMTMRQLLDT